jgi:hypothetical protein
VALRYLTRNDDWKELRERIDTRVEGLLEHKSASAVPADLLQGINDDLASLQRHFDRESVDMPMSRQQETDARRFLRKVKDVLGQFPTSVTVSTSTYR